jgi:Type VI secretion system (T6SS), amidase effector protein 4
LNISAVDSNSFSIVMILLLQTNTASILQELSGMPPSKLSTSIERLIQNYPRRLNKEGAFGGKLAVPELRKLMEQCPGTPCCVQVSHALNMTGNPVPEHYPGERRFAIDWKTKKTIIDPATGKPKLTGNPHADIGGKRHFFLLAVDEMETYLTWKYGPGESVNNPAPNVGRRTAKQVKDHLGGRTGILVMLHPKDGHTELWDGTSFAQKDMAVDHLLSVPRVLFWDCGPPQWLQDSMAT